MAAIIRPTGDQEEGEQTGVFDKQLCSEKDTADDQFQLLAPRHS